LSIVGFIAWLCFSAADGSTWTVGSLVAVLALAALVGVGWYLPRARTESRWRAALDWYADQQQTNSPVASVRRPVETE